MRFAALADQGLSGGYFGLEVVAVVLVGLFLGGEGGDCGVHFGGFGGFFLQGFGVGAGEGGEGLDAGLVGAVGLCW